MNPASEATLAELLAVNKQMAGAVSQLAAKSSGGGAQPVSGGGGGGGPDPKGPGLFSKALSGAGSLLTGTFSVAANLATAGFNGIVQTGAALIQGQKQLMQGAIDGSNGLASFANSLKDLPFGLGLIATAYAYQQEILAKNLHTYQAISDTGANLGSSLNSVRDAAKGMGLNMSEFTAVMKAAGPELARMGGTAGEGSRALVKFNREMIQGSVGKGLLGLGYTLQEANGLLANYSSIVGGLTSDQMKDQKKMEQSVSMFATELEVSAQLEGKSRQQKEQEMKKAAENAAVQARLSTMGADEKAAYTVALSKAMREGGQGAVDLLNAQVGGFIATSKEAQMTMAIMPKVAAQAKNMGDTVVGAGTLIEKKAKLDKQSSEMGYEAAKSVEKFGAAGRQIAGTMTGPLASAMQAGYNTQARQNAQGVKSLDDKIKLDKKAEAEAEAKKNSEAGAAAQREAKEKWRTGIQDKLYESLARLFPIVERVVEVFTKAFEWAINLGSHIIPHIVSGFKRIFEGVSLDSVIKPFKDFWKGLTGGFSSGDINFQEIEDTIVSFFKPIVETFGSLVRSVNFEDVGKYLRTIFIGIKDFATGVFGSFKSVDTGSIVDFFKSFFAGFSQMYGLLAEAIGRIDFKGIGAGLGRALKTAFDAIRDIFQPVFEKAGPILSQIGSELGPVFNDIADIINIVATAIADSIGAIVKIISNILVPVLKPIISGLMDAVLPFWEAVKNFIKIVKALLQGDFKSLPQLFSNMWKGIIDSFKELINGIWEGVKTLFSPSKWFDGVGDKKAETKTQAAPNTQAAASQNQGAIDKLANDWAYSVYSGKNTLAQVPKDALAKVQDILKNPPGNWKTEVNKTQQQNATAPKTETPTSQTTAKTAEKKEEKVAATPAVDLNNKDALVVLKTLADYQRRTIDAVNNLNGNILKRA